VNAEPTITTEARRGERKNGKVAEKIKRKIEKSTFYFLCASAK
jgi:hypothetical protein